MKRVECRKSLKILWPLGKVDDEPQNRQAPLLSPHWRLAWFPGFAKPLSHHGWHLASYAEAAVWVWMEGTGEDRLVSSCTSVIQSAITIWWLSWAIKCCCWRGATHLLTQMRKLNCTLEEPLPAASFLSLGKQKLKKSYPLIVGSSCRFRWPTNHACRWPKLSLPRVAGPSICQHVLERKLMSQKICAPSWGRVHAYSWKCPSMQGFQLDPCAPFSIWVNANMLWSRNINACTGLCFFPYSVNSIS